MLAISRISKSAVLLLLISAPAIGQEAVRWSEDLQQATQIAAQSNKLVLVHFWAPWCKPCLRMEEEVFNQPGVGAAIEASFVPVKLNADQFAATARSFGITSLPSDVILSPQGQVVAKYNSPKTAAAYLAQANQVATANVTQQAGNTPLAGAAAAGQFAANTTPPAVSPPPINDRYAVPAQHSQPMQNMQDRYAAPADRYAATGPGSQTSAPPMDRYGAPTHNPYAASPNAPAGPTGYAGPPASSNPGAANQGAAIGSRYGQGPPAAAPAEQVTSNPYAQVEIPPMNTIAPQATMNPYMQQAQSSAPQFGQRPPATPWNPQPQVPAAQANPYLGQASSGPPQQAAAPSPAPSAFGMEGYCPVTMIEAKTWTPGDRRFGAIHEGTTYLFSSAENQQKFLADPYRFAPAMAGADPVAAIDAGQSVAGQRRHGVSYNNRVYLFSSEASLAQFSQNPDRYVNGIRQAMQQATQYPRR